MPTTSLITALVTALVTALAGQACTNEPELAARDTVRITDTVDRVDTIVRVVRVDTMVRAEALGLEPPEVSAADLSYLRSRRLLIPVPGVEASELPNTFDEARAQGARRHDAIDILAPRGTPVRSVDAGRVVKIDTSERGGLSLYASDPSGRFMFYYAHLDRYRADLQEGMPLARGDLVGYVGTSGNAPPNTPHLHFAINALGDSKRWWDGTPINPWPLLTETR